MRFPIPGDWDGQSWCRWAICWPDSELWRGFLRGLLTLPQRGWTWDEKSGNLLDVIAVGREITAQNLPLRGVLMSCDDSDLVTAFNNIALALNRMADRSSGSGCCDDAETLVQTTIQTSVVSPSTGDSVPVYGSQSPIGHSVSTFPDGFDSEEQYLVEKCQKASQLIDGLILTLRLWGAFTTFNTVALTGLVAVSIAAGILFPPSLIPTAIVFIIALSGSMFLLDQAADHIQANRQEWICALYDSDATEGIIGTLSDLIDILIAAIPVGGAFALAVKSIILLIINGDNLNTLFQRAAFISQPNADCTSCKPTCFEFDLADEVADWTILDHAGTIYTVTWVDDSAMRWNQAGQPASMPKSYSPSFYRVIEPGDILSLCFVPGHPPYGISFGLVLNGVEEILISQGTVPAHVNEESFDLTPFAGDVATRIILGLNVAGSGYWDIERIGINCPEC